MDGWPTWSDNFKFLFQSCCSSAAAWLAVSHIVLQAVFYRLAVRVCRMMLYAQWLSVQTIQNRLHAANHIAWPAMIAPHRNTYVGTWTYGGTWSSAASPGLSAALGSQGQSVEKTQKHFSDCCTDSVSFGVGSVMVSNSIFPAENLFFFPAFSAYFMYKKEKTTRLEPSQLKVSSVSY